MINFNIGDTVERIDNKDGSYPIGYRSVVSDSISDCPGYLSVTDKDGSCRPLFEHQWKLVQADTDELTELRKFRDDAIAKYPDLAPVSEEDKFIVTTYEQMMGYTEGSKTLKDVNSRWTEIARRSIQWGKDHA